MEVFCDEISDVFPCKVEESGLFLYDEFYEREIFLDFADMNDPTFDVDKTVFV